MPSASRGAAAPENGVAAGALNDDVPPLLLLAAALLVCHLRVAEL